MADAVEEFDTSWIDDLKRSLLSGCDLQTVRRICNFSSFPDSIRADIWKVCLSLDDKEKEPVWDEIFDLPEQGLIREHCQNFVDRLGNEEEDKLCVVSDLESVITRFCKENGRKYSSSTKWLEVLAPLIALHLPKTELYKYFCAIQKLYIPRNCVENGNPFHLFRLLLLYHEPELCSLLDTKKIPPDTYAKDWGSAAARMVLPAYVIPATWQIAMQFSSLFASSCSLRVVQLMWDIYFQYADPFFVFFLALVILANAKDQLLEMKNESSQTIIDTISSLFCDLEADDVKDFCSLAEFFVSFTPRSFAKEYYHLIFGDQSHLQSNALSQALCLPVSVKDLLSRNRSRPDYRVKFFVVDCRPAEQYNSGHLSTAFHLEASLMLQEPAAFSTALEALQAAKDQSIAANSVAAGDQICFMGSGREEEDQYVHMVIASLLQKHQKYVSLARGGYAALHILVKDKLDSYLADHCPKTCLMCQEQQVSMHNGVEEKGPSIIDRLASVVINRGATVRERFLEYIANPQTVEERHVSCRDRLGKRYRGITPVFSIDDEHEDEKISETDDEYFEEVSIQTWQQKPDVIGSFECFEIKNEVRYPSFLVVTNTHMYILRVNSRKKGYAYIVARRPLANIMKITTKKRCPECITFTHGITENEQSVITATDCLLIPKAGDAAHIIKYQIIDLSWATENR